MPFDPIFKLRPSEVYAALESSPGGLSSAQVSERLPLYGKNTLRVETSEPTWRPWLRLVSHPLSAVLWLAGVLALVSGDWVLALGFWGLVVTNGLLTLWRERRAARTMQALAELMPEYARVVREGHERNLPALELVPGDVLVLAEGDHVPADARLVEAYGLRVNNASLTGEALPALKFGDASLREDVSELEHPNLVFAGTTVHAGTGLAVVYATGMATQFGRIARLAQAVVEPPSRLHTEMEQLSRRMGWAAAIVAALTGLVAFVDMGYEFQPAFVLALGVLVALTPASLPANLTLALASAAQRLARQGIWVKKLSTLETLGTITTLCTDKSGTLTQNQMTVQEVWSGGQTYRVTGSGYDPQGQISPHPPGSLGMLLAAALLCNNARLTPPAPGRPTWSSLGDQTESALRVLALKGGLVEAQLEKRLPRLHEIPFDAQRKRMTTIHRIRLEQTAIRKTTRSYMETAVLNWLDTLQQDSQIASQPELAFVKGAPRELLAQCSHIQDGETLRPLVNTNRQEIMRQVDGCARRALRVLALAYRVLPPRSGSYSVEGVERGLVFLGLAAMMDPPRPEIARAVETLRDAGIRLVMVTGDYGLTAESVARRLGIVTSPEAQILNGYEYEQLTSEELQPFLEHETVFARMAPEHKLSLVAALQGRGEVVAVIGDGVNDAPALRKANLGVSMGLTGTAVARDAADVVLTSDHFGGVVTAIAEGRAVYQNLRKVLTYILSSNVAEMAPLLLSALFNLPAALTVRQILVIDLLTDMLPSLALGAEKPEIDVMRQPPRSVNQPLFDRGLSRRAFLWLGPLEALLALSGYAAVWGLYALSGPTQGPAVPTWLAGLSAWLEQAGWSYAGTLARWLPGLGELDLGSVARLASTAYLAGVVMTQAGNAFACRTELNRTRSQGWLSNPFLWISVGVSLVLLGLVVYVSPLARLFGHLPLPGITWVWLAPYPLAVYGLEWIRKSLVRVTRQRSNGK